MAEREGFSGPAPWASKTAVKSAFSDNPRRVVCTCSLYRLAFPCSSEIRGLVNAFPPLASVTMLVPPPPNRADDIIGKVADELQIGQIFAVVCDGGSIKYRLAR
jgi:hypothetical protein